jgi:hypothetical protein
MKNLFILVLLSAFIAKAGAQELDSLKAIMGGKQETVKSESEKDAVSPVSVENNGDEVKVVVMDKEIVKVVDNEDTTLVKLGNKGIIRVIEQPDSTRIRVGDKEISIVERNGDDAHVSVNDIDDNNSIRSPKFRGHWAGFEWGINNFLDKNNTISREGDAWFMDLNTGRSWAINLNFAQYSLGFGTSHAGILTGLGLEYNNYFFDNAYSIKEPDDYVIVDTLDGNVAKSKLTTAFLRIPLILEVQFPRAIRSKRVYISAGIVAGLKLGSHTKVVYKGNSGKNKDKNNDDFNISPYRYGLTARVGFGNLSVFGDYYFTSMFVKGKGPVLHPFSVGIAMDI